MMKLNIIVIVLLNDRLMTRHGSIGHVRRTMQLMAGMLIKIMLIALMVVVVMLLMIYLRVLQSFLAASSSCCHRNITVRDGCGLHVTNLPLAGSSEVSRLWADLVCCRSLSWVLNLINSCIGVTILLSRLALLHIQVVAGVAVEILLNWIPLLVARLEWLVKSLLGRVLVSDLIVLVGR